MNVSRQIQADKNRWPIRVRHLTIDRFQNKNKRPRCIKDENGIWSLSDKQTGMADDFPKTVSKTAGVLKTHFLNDNFAWIPSSSLRIRRGGYNHLHSIFSPRALRY